MNFYASPLEVMLMQRVLIEGLLEAKRFNIASIEPRLRRHVEKIV